MKKYKSWKNVSYKILLLKVLIIALLTALVCFFHCKYIYPDLSILTLVSSILIVFLLNLLTVSIYQGYRYATFMDVNLPIYKARAPISVLAPSEKINNEKFHELKQLITENTNNKTFDFFLENVPLKSTNTYITQTTHRLNIQLLTEYKYDFNIINFVPHNRRFNFANAQ